MALRRDAAMSTGDACAPQRCRCMPTKREYEAARRERMAREKGRALGHYTKKVTKKLAGLRRGGRSTPSKKAR